MMNILGYKDTNNEVSNSGRKPLNQALKLDGIILAIGLVYFIWFRLTSIGIQCIIYKSTGFYCPSCGATRMVMALAKLDFITAFQMNPFLLSILPYGIFIYIRKYVYLLGKGIPFTYQRYHIYIGIFLIVAAITFGVIRNFPSYGFLRP